MTRENGFGQFGLFINEVLGAYKYIDNSLLGEIQAWAGSECSMEGQISFIKMEGAGNDYVYVDCFDQYVKNPQLLARKVSSRHFGVGSDGLILLKPSPRADCFMDIYNKDGSRGRTCGNGLRCAARYMWEKSGKKKTAVCIETLSGICRAYVHPINRRRCWVQVDMGRGFTRDIPVPVRDVGRLLPPGVFVAGASLCDVGNLHCVVMIKDCREAGESPALDVLDLKTLGPFLENYPEFGEKVNVEVCLTDDEICKTKVPGSLAVRARVWERGSGETLACGSGACAVYLAAARLTVSDGGKSGGALLKQCCVFMPGGRLHVEAMDGHLFLGGYAAEVFRGQI